MLTPIEREVALTESQIVSYRVDGETVATFEIDPPGGFIPASEAGEIVAEVRNAVGPAVAAAKVVLERMRPLDSEAVELRFGVKVSGTKDWSVARRASEGTFEVTLSWRPTT